MFDEFAGYAPEDRAIMAKLEETPVVVSFESEELVSVFESLAGLYELNLDAQWEAMETAGIQQDREISIKFRGVSLASALNSILEHAAGGETELAYEAMDGRLVVFTREDLNRRPRVHIYHVGELLAKIDRPLRAGDAAARERSIRIPPGASSSASSGPSRIDQLAMVIVENVEPDSWRMAGGNIGTISICGDALVITQTPACHRQLAKLLNDLDREYSTR